MKNTVSFINQQLIFNSAYPSIDEFVLAVQKNQDKTKPIKLFYGETYDELGMTLDSLKYYLVLGLIQRLLTKDGYIVEATVVVADAAVLINKSAASKEATLQASLPERIKMLQRLIACYKLPVTITLMSELFQTDAYKEKFHLVNKYAQNGASKLAFFDQLKKTVLKNKIAQEEKQGYRYALEAVATSLLFDIKIGPPREIFYDQASQYVVSENRLNPLVSLYLRPSLPLGKDFSYFLSHPEIEEFGLTPYKAGSNGLQNHRIILNKTTLEDATQLITDSFEAAHSLVAHPVLEVYLVALLARYFREDHKEVFDELCSFSLEKLEDVTTFKTKTLALLDSYVLQPMAEGQI